MCCEDQGPKRAKASSWQGLSPASTSLALAVAASTSSAAGRSVSTSPFEASGNISGLSAPLRHTLSMTWVFVDVCAFVRV